MTSKVKVTGCRYLEWTCGWIAGACAIDRYLTITKQSGTPPKKKAGPLRMPGLGCGWYQASSLFPSVASLTLSIS